MSDEVLPNGNHLHLRSADELDPLWVRAVGLLARVLDPVGKMLVWREDPEKVELKRKLKAVQVELYEVDQVLGRALGYPAMGPEVGGDGTAVCTGPHTATTLADEAADLIRQLRHEPSAHLELAGLPFCKECPANPSCPRNLRCDYECWQDLQAAEHF